MATPRVPQDRRPKDGDGRFSFTSKGKTYTFPRPFAEVQNPKFLREHRRRDELDLTFTILETLADDDPDIMAAIDAMPLAEFNKLSARLNKALNEAVGGAGELGE